MCVPKSGEADQGQRLGSGPSFINCQGDVGLIFLGPSFSICEFKDVGCLKDLLNIELLGF